MRKHYINHFQHLTPKETEDQIVYQKKIIREEYILDIKPASAKKEYRPYVRDPR
ncbi:hypothetical protein BpOF4_21274 (plasmid) [Alkalihalophilus pseudofirmus OF4]|uniref:Uncharacterized protein n=1 Tax=Alkalihalophilus pseudofirmus (strain ATCC BAA-2126 / JCM 17055 / OF4) TaxID=398511 RepID=D3G1M4_ALKPO|nr:hypothetical protein BpOF4_21274 [Alkalihalophilus pseudofirmus OF4]